MAWLPSDLGQPIAAWLDANEESTGSLSTWGDRSGNGNDMTEASGTQPEIVEHGGMKWLKFTTDSYLTGPNILNNTEFSVFVIWDSQQENGRIIDNRGSGIGWSGAGVQIKTPRPNGDVILIGDGTNWTAVSAYGPHYDTRISSVLFKPGNDVGYRDQGAFFPGWKFEWEGGDQETRDFVEATPEIGCRYNSDTLPEGVASPNSLFIGANTLDTAKQKFIGRIGEIVIFSERLNVFESEHIEGYLAHKWGVSGSLPDWHTFKDAPPEDPRGGTQVKTAVSGKVHINGQPTARTVRAFGYKPTVYDQNGVSISESRSLGSAISDPETGEYTIELLGGYQGDVFVVAFDDYGQPFIPNLEVSAGDRVHPSTPDGYVYRCESSGTLPETEPTWVADTETSNQYGTASMIAVPFYRPMVHGPITPEVVDDGTSGSG